MSVDRSRKMLTFVVPYYGAYIRKCFRFVLNGNVAIFSIGRTTDSTHSCLVYAVYTDISDTSYLFECEVLVVYIR